MSRRRPHKGAWSSGSTRAWRVLRAQVLSRDRGICHLCGQAGADQADHLIPRSRGGQDTLDNLKAAHGSCNRDKSDGPSSSPLPLERPPAPTKTLPKLA